MDEQWLDDLMRKLAVRTSRRTALRGLLVGAGAALGWRREAEAVTQALCGNMVCGYGVNTCQPICTGTMRAAIQAAATVDGDFNCGR